MFLRIRYLIVVLACLGIAIAPQLSWAESHYRLAKAYAEKNDAERAATYFSLALKNASPRQVPEIASDYAAFLLKKKDFHKAELMLRQALAQSPHDEALIENLARCLVLQEKVIEGLRYFKSIYSEADARKKIAAIYREQENADMLVAVEKNWGEPKREPLREYSEPESTYVAAIPKPVLPVAKVPTSRPAAVEPAEMANVLPAPMLPAPTVVARKPVAPLPFASASPAAAPVRSELSKSELFDTKIPIPVPRPAPLTMVAKLPKPAPLPPMPAPLREQTVVAKLPRPAAPLPVAAHSVEGVRPVEVARSMPKKRSFALVNPVKLSAAPQPVPAEDYVSKTAAVRRPGKHYIINASASTDLDALFPVKPVAAVVPVQ